MILAVILLGIVVLTIIIPGLSTATRIAILLGILGLVIFGIWYGGKFDLSMSATTKESTNEASGSNECNTCNGPPKANDCDECSSNPCKCSEVLPGQSRCPKCPGALGSSVIGGIMNCDKCGRHFRCPGCLLGANNDNLSS